MFQIDYQIQNSDVEPGYDHVNHATSLRFLELARLRFLEHIGFPNERFIKQDLFLVVAAISVRYKRELFHEKVIVTCENPRIDGRSLFLDQRIIKERGKVAIEATIEFMFMLGATKRALLPPEDFARAFVDVSL